MNTVEVDTRTSQAFHLNAAAFIIAHGADVSHTQAKLGTSYHRARDLASGTQDLLAEGYFAGIRGEFGNQDQSVGRVKTNAHKVEIGHSVSE